MKIVSITFIAFGFINTAIAQVNLPKDYLSKDFHRSRREAFRNLMPENSVAVIFSYPERNFSNDVNYVYHQNPNLYYLSGYNEPDAVLLIFKNMQAKGDTTYNEIIFVRERDKLKETWTGRRLGIEGTKEKLGFARVYEGKDFKPFSIDLKNFKTVLYEATDNALTPDNTAYGLYDLVQTFKQKAGIPQPDMEQEGLHNIQRLIAGRASMQNLDQVITRINRAAQTNEAIKNDSLVQQILAHPDSIQLQAIKTKIAALKNSIDIFNEIITSLRQIKTTEELALMNKAAKISAVAHSETMKAISPDISENEIEGIHRYIHKKYGAEEEAYPPIVGAGANGCILHYEENNSTRIDNQLLLMDVAAEYHGYAADVTRTIPASGKFSPEQKAIYELVYNAQEAVMKLCIAGTPFSKLNEKATEILAAGLLKLGIIKDRKEIRIYYPHSCSHFIGLDVHDIGEYSSLLKENMVITVEPGIYIPAESNCDKKWWNIGVRIEDDVAIGKSTFKILSADAPRQWSDIEKMAKQKSIFKHADLPKLQ